MKPLMLAITLAIAATHSAWADNVNALPATAGLSATGLLGTIIDAKTMQPIPFAVVQAAWVLRAEGDRKKQGVQKTKRLWVRQIFSDASGRFDFANEKQFADAPGWKLLPGQDPIIRIYAKGYQRLVIENTVKGRRGMQVPVNRPNAAEQKWVGEAKTQAMTPLSDTESALAKELVIWKADLENEIALSPAADRESAIRSQEKLLAAFDDACNRLSASKRSGLCYGTDSELGQYLAQVQAERTKFLVVELPDGRIKKYPLQIHSSSANQVAPRQIVGPASPYSAATQGVIGTSLAAPAPPPGK